MKIASVLNDLNEVGVAELCRLPEFQNISGYGYMAIDKYGRCVLRGSLAMALDADVQYVFGILNYQWKNADYTNYGKRFLGLVNAKGKPISKIQGVQ